MVVTSVVVIVNPIYFIFFATTRVGLAIFIVLLIAPFVVLCPLQSYYKRHPLNYFLLGLFTVTLAFPVGLNCAYTRELEFLAGKVILEAVVLTAVVVISHTLYTFWAARRGQDFNFLGPFLFGAIIVLFLFSVIQIFFPLGKTSVIIYGGLASIIFWAAVALYLDVINLFLSSLNILRAADS